MTHPDALSDRPELEPIGNDRLLFGMILGVLAFWLFAQTMLNVAPTMASALGIQTSVMNIAVSITALFSGIFVVVTASLALLISSLTGRRMFSAASVVGVFVVTIPMAAVIWEVGGDSVVRDLSGIATPTWLVMGIGDWLLGHEAVVDVKDLGPVYGAAGVALVAACVAILLARYRRVEQ